MKLETSRLILRRPLVEDYASMRLLDSDPEVMKWTRSRAVKTEEETKRRLGETVSKTTEPFGVWLAFTKSNEFVGWFMLIQSELAWPELGFMIVQPRWGQGYAVEACRELIKHAKENLRLPGLSAITDERNQSSQKVLKNLGFVLLGKDKKLDPVLGEEVVLQNFELRLS